MSAEQKAREIVASLFPALTPVGVESFTRERAEVEAALREAENAAYEKAAQIAEGGIYEVSNPDVTIPLTGPEIAHFIRALKGAA